jgi:hypothetical protein
MPATQTHSRQARSQPEQLSKRLPDKGASMRRRLIGLVSLILFAAVAAQPGCVQIDTGENGEDAPVIDVDEDDQ